MIPDPSYFTGGHRQRCQHAAKIWEDVRLLIMRSAVYEMGAHPHAAELNARWRHHIAEMDEQDCLRFLVRLEAVWPARRFRR